ncbi:MAG: putative lipid II flippase FtsW [Candidatus Omnitrophica bacterium]|nr:putative lipid II flippase FtsW [Candidatus Omnitrophota bacterium]
MILDIEKVVPGDLKKERKFLFVTFLALTLFGVLMIYEASSLYAFKASADPAYFFKKQAFSFLVGILFFSLTLLIDLEFLKRHNKKFLMLTFSFLILIIFFGKSGGGARRWLSIGPIGFQPSELLKVTFLLYCADYCNRKRGLIQNVRLGLIPLGFVLLSICSLLILQPDLGTAIFWVFWTILFLFLFGARRKHLGFVILVGAVIAFFLIKLYPYRVSRIIAYFDPFKDPKGAGFQLIQSQIAYGVGGFWGVGLGEGLQKLFFLPAAHTDFIFSIIAEEFGLWGSLGLIFIFFVIFHKMFIIAKFSQDGFKRGILWGIVLIFFLEIGINVGVSCGLFPTKGLPLPFMSYGGSSLVVHYILLGLFLNASRQEDKVQNLSAKS